MGAEKFEQGFMLNRGWGLARFWKRVWGSWACVGRGTAKRGAEMLSEGLLQRSS